MEEVELVAFCDLDEERAKWAASQYGGRAYTDHRKMYDEEEMDAVFICLPPSPTQTRNCWPPRGALEYSSRSP